MCDQLAEVVTVLRHEENVERDAAENALACVRPCDEALKLSRGLGSGSLLVCSTLTRLLPDRCVRKTPRTTSSDSAHRARRRARWTKSLPQTRCVGLRLGKGKGGAIRGRPSLRTHPCVPT